MPIYMNWGGGVRPKLTGSVTQDRHRGWIEVFALRPGARGSNGKGSREIRFDTTDPLVRTFFLTANGRQPVSDVQFDVVKTPTEPWLVLYLRDARIASAVVRLQAVSVTLHFASTGAPGQGNVPPRWDPYFNDLILHMRDPT